MTDGGSKSRNRRSPSSAEAECSEMSAERAPDRDKNRRLWSNASTKSTGSSESGESSKGSSSHTTISVAMVDGFAFFALAIQDNLRAKMKKLKRGGDVSDQLFFSKQRREGRMEGRREGVPQVFLLL